MSVDRDLLNAQDDSVPVLQIAQAAPNASTLASGASIALGTALDAVPEVAETSRIAGVLAFDYLVDVLRQCGHSNAVIA